MSEIESVGGNGVEPTASPDSAASSYRGHRVQLGSFDGPLDLLLHLVRINEVEIIDLPIVEITKQYNTHLELMQDFDLEVAGEFLVMAATLMHIKSRLLLPPDPEEASEEGATDPRAELAQQLLEYQRFKQAAETLQAMDTRRQLIWTRERVAAEFADEEMLSVDMFDLLTAFRSLLGRLGEEARLQLRRDTVSVADKIQWLTDLLERRPSINLLELLTDLPSRLDRIAAFLALLEMLRLQLVAAFQRSIGGEIRIVAVDPRDRADSEIAGADYEGEQP